jgi:hypothetical protein
MTENYWPGLLFPIINTSEYKGFWPPQDPPYVVVNDETQFNSIQAADFLNVSLNYFKSEVAPKLDKTLNDKWATWRFLYKDLAAYRKEEEKEFEKAMKELTELEQEMGLYDINGF